MIIDRLPNFHIEPTDFIRKSLEGGTAVLLGLSIGYAIYTNNEGSKTPDAAVANAANGKINSSSEETTILAARMPETPLRPIVSINYEQKSTEGGVKVAGAYIIGVNKKDKDNPVKETAQFDLVRYQNGEKQEFGIDIGDGVIREITRSKDSDTDKKKAILVDEKLLLEIELNETLPTDPLSKITFNKVDKITVYGKRDDIAIVLDANCLKEYPASANNLFNLGLFLLQNTK